MRYSLTCIQQSQWIYLFENYVILNKKYCFCNFRIEETERLENIGDRECAFYGMKRNGELTLFTADCESKAGALCVGKGEWNQFNIC